MNERQRKKPATLGRLLGMNTADLDSLESGASRALKEEDWPTAIDILTFLTHERPKAGHLWAGLGAARAALKDDAGAEMAMEKALSLNEQDIYSIVNLGELLLGKRRDEEALALFVKAIELDSKCVHPAALRARALILSTKRLVEGS